VKVEVAVDLLRTEALGELLDDDDRVHA